MNDTPFWAVFKVVNHRLWQRPFWASSFISATAFASYWGGEIYLALETPHHV